MATLQATAAPAPVEKKRSNQMRERGMPTLSDVAALAGVSKVSASVALNGAKSGTVLSEATRGRIVMAAEELGYKRNGSMASATTGRFGCVALLLSTEEYRSNLPQPMWNGIHDELAAHNMHLTMARLPDEKLTDEGVVPKILREWMADGLLIDYTHHIPQRMLGLIRAHQMPAVWINSKQGSDCVYPDDHEAAARLTRHLLQLGHTRVLYLDFIHGYGNGQEHYSYLERVAGYRSAMQDAGLTPRVEPGTWIPEDQRETHIGALLQESERPTAILTYGDGETDMIAPAAAELGLRMPRDLSIASFLPAGTRYMGRALTTCSVPEYAMGRSATQMLRQKIQNPAHTLAPVALKFEFEAGQTCAPPKS